jgi:hypothetical protein
MSLTRDESCGCPPLAHPPSPDIPAGLPTLSERQLSGFPEYRAAMLSAIPNYLEFTDWRARSEADLGVMLLEAWSVVLDTTAFYDARIAERSYLQTAPDQAAARNLTALIGHRPRPDIAARVDLAVQADGADPVTLPKITAFRSGPFDGEPPQVFELVTSHQIWPQRNRWKLAPVRDAAFDGTLRFLPRRAPSAGAMLVIWSATQATAARVLSIDPDPAPDGVTYQKAILETESNPGLSAMIGAARTSLSIAILRQPMSEYEGPYDSTTGVVDLDSVYPQLRPGQRAVAEIGDELYPVELVSVSRILKTIPDTGEPPAKQAVTQVSFTPEPTLAVGTLTLHGNPFPLGGPSRIARTRIQLADLQNSGSLVAPLELGEAPGGGSVIARGEGTEGARLGGTVIEDGDGQAHFAPDTGSTDFGKLATPVKLFGNVVEAVRGETVTDEELGSGNAAEPHQKFTLKKKPLTWVEDASLAEGRRAELTLRVGGLEWARVETFFSRKPDERIYTVTLEPDGGSRINFGDGKRGARVPSGVGNVRADYRYGAGAAKPPAGSIQSIARPTKGLLSVIGPVPARGGADAETADELRQSAPATALTLGRAVSLADFEAMARAYSGVVNAASAWAWDIRRQRASATLWIITDSGDPSADLANYLAARAAPDLTVAVNLAGSAAFSTLAITLAYSDGYDPTLVRDAIETALFDNIKGFLAPRNQTIGGTLFRSALTHRLHEVAGVSSVPTIQLDGISMPHAVAAGQGLWFDIEIGTTVT